MRGRLRKARWNAGLDEAATRSKPDPLRKM